METHCHADHLTACHYVKKRYPNALRGIGTGIRQTQATFKEIYGLDFATDGSQFDLLFEDNYSLYLGTIPMKILSTPGHTLDSISYLIGDSVFVGDLLFLEDSGTGRCDFPNGSASQLYRSIVTRILTLPSTTRLFVCHDYGCNGSRAVQFESTVKSQFLSNIHVKQGIERNDFIKIREERDSKLSFPKLLIPSIQFNVQGGQGVEYLKCPLNQTSKFCSTPAND